MGLQVEVDEAVQQLRRAGTDLQAIEVKAAAGGLPRSTAETVSAFANGQGGLLLLGLDESAGFAPVSIDAAKLASDLAAACADQLEPPVRPEIDVVTVDGQPVVAARVEELPADRKPCHLRARGIDRGSFLRTHDGDRSLSSYEVHVLVASRGQPRDDMAPVDRASVRDLDPELVESLVRRLRETRGPIFANATDEEILTLVGVLISVDGEKRVSLAGLLALGRYPQQHFPQLDATFVSYPVTSGEPLPDGTRFLDNQSIDGPIPVQVTAALAAMRRNMKRRSIIVGLGREDRWEYPEEAVREIVANALMHRDYHPLAHGAQVRIELYPDRLEVTSPGGLHGPISRDDLLAESVSSSRNALLAKLLEDVEVPGTGRTVCENRGSGLLATAAALRDAGIEPPSLRDNVREFRVVVRNHGLLDPEAVSWLSTIDTVGLTDRQRLGLAFLWRNERITNQQYRTLTGCDSLTATRELVGMADRGLVAKTSDRRWAVWHLSEVLGGDSEEVLEQPRFTFDPGNPKPVAGRRDRREEIRVLLADGPMKARDLADALSMTVEGAHQWLRRLEAEGRVQPTAINRRSPTNQWEWRP